ncbi:unnamed protein product [Parnassius apollo]|uniref:(apollo) hypothetical protein n=1 Tax=Parnassius apollo TaxID=110799 RepID=A0A8S3XKY8_PARAO|nr:unnamed protein product [Parnassius apollo]
MANVQYLPGDPRLVDQLVYELKSKGIFDQFRKDCIADVDTRPAYQNLRQRVESSVSTFLSRQCWQPDLNKNQLREKLRKHILDGNYLEQGVERIVDQVVNPKVASVFIPQVEDLVYNYLGITRKKSVPNAETSNGKIEDLLPTDLEAVSPGSVKSNDDKNEQMDIEANVVEETNYEKMEVDKEEKPKSEIKDEVTTGLEVNNVEKEKSEVQESQLSGVSELTCHESDVSFNKSSIPLPGEDIKLENIPPPENSPPKIVELEKIELPKIMNCPTDIPLPDEILNNDKDNYFKTINSDDDDSSSDSSLRRNMSPLTPIRNYNNENSCDAQQGFDNDSVESKSDDKKEPTSFRFTIEAKAAENFSDAAKTPKKPTDQLNLAYQFNNQVNIINTFNTPMYEDSSNSNNLQIDYESDANSKAVLEAKIVEAEISEDSKKERKVEDKKSTHKSSHRSRDSHKHSSSKGKKPESKQSTSRDSSRHDKKSSKDDHSKSKSSHKESSRDRSDKKDSKESSRHSSHKSSSQKDSKSHKSSSSSHRHSSKHSDDKKTSSSSSHRSKTEKSSDRSKDKSKDSKSSSSQRSDKDKKSSSKSKHEEKEKEKKEKKETDDHYSLSGRGNPNRRSTDRDSNDGSSSSKGSQNPASSKSSESKKETKGGSSKSDNMSTSSEGTSPCDRELTLQEKEKEVIDMLQPKPIVRIETHLGTPIASPPRLPFVPDITLKKPKFAANLEEAKRLMKMRRFLDEEQKRMNQEAALLLEFQANVRPSLSQIYSSIPGPELEFACVTNTVIHTDQLMVRNNDSASENTVEYSIEHSNYAEDEGFSDHIEDDIPSTLTVKEVEESIESINEELNNKAKAHATEESLSKETYYESKNSETTKIETEYSTENKIGFNDNVTNNSIKNDAIQEEENKKRTEFFEVTIITEELSESEDLISQKNENKIHNNIDNQNENNATAQSEQNNFHYFGEHEKYKAELERDQFTKFFKVYTERASANNKIYLINCDTYEEQIMQEALETFGQFEIINYQRNGHLKLPKISKNIVKNVNLSTEVSLPFDNEMADEFDNRKPLIESVFSPVKSECSFELSSDYNERLEEMVNKTSRQEIMEIILGNVIADSPTKMPKIDYFTDSNIECDIENNTKRKISEVETVNNNRHILTPNKVRRLSTSDQISSTTEDLDERSNKCVVPNSTRSKYLGRARRVGLPRPRKTELPNSPSSDKSVENYEHNTPTTQPPNGKIKSTPRNKVQRYETSDLYKPKLHYLSRRNNIS